MSTIRGAKNIRADGMLVHQTLAALDHSQQQSPAAKRPRSQSGTNALRHVRRAEAHAVHGVGGAGSVPRITSVIVWPQAND